tara:strand:- start:1426 stop:1563 length:138 start_codon:yes stop_codon:yes gene_type:complete
MLHQIIAEATKSGNSSSTVTTTDESENASNSGIDSEAVQKGLVEL